MKPAIKYLNTRQNVKHFLAFSIIIFLFVNQTSAQKKRWKDYLITGSSMFVSGMLDGTIESISYHYEDGFRPRFAKLNDNFWNPAISWKNKYKNGMSNEGPKFPGSTNLLVCTTDAYHLLRTTKRTIDGGTLVYYVNDAYSERCEVKPRGARIKKIIIDFVFLTFVRCVGFHVTYSLAFKPIKN
jgi:hypothetical protein